MRRRHELRRILALPVVLALTVVMAPSANAQDDSWIDESLLSGSSDPFFVGGEYSWGLEEISPMQDPNTYPVTVTFAWGDGDQTQASTETGDIWCWDENEDVEPPAPEWRCSTWVGMNMASRAFSRSRPRPSRRAEMTANLAEAV